jgi:3-hydroxyacyl-CoA dehydrogenase
VAIAQAKAMADSRLARAAEGPVPGGRPQCHRHHQGQLVNMRDGGFISAHDFHIASLIADVVCGGDVDAGSRWSPRST